MFVSLSLTAYDFSFLIPTIQSKLSRQSCHQSRHSILSYCIQLTSLFDHAFLSSLDHPLGSIGDPKDLLDHLVCPKLSRSSALHRASWISHYTIRVYLQATRLRG